MGLPNWHRKCYGYERTAGSLVINHGEAKIVQWIFESYCNGNNFNKIAKGSKMHATLSLTGKANWSREAISKLLSNEKYTRSVLLQKIINEGVHQVKN